MYYEGKWGDQRPFDGSSPTPEECVSAPLHQEREKFLEAIHGRWGKKITVKDWGLDILNLVPDPENNDPWEA
jgi:hypothetical protein